MKQDAEFPMCTEIVFEICLGVANAVYDSAANWASTWTVTSVTLGELWWLYRVPLLTMWCLGSGVTGYLVTRLRRHRAAALFIWATSPLPWATVWALPIWRLGHVLPFFRGFPVLINAMVLFLVLPICILLGGVWGVRPAPRACSA